MPVHLTKEGCLNTLSEEEEAKTEDAELITSFEEWEARAGSWPLKRLVAIWNDLPGVVPVQKFTSRDIALERIWRFLHASEPARQRKREEQTRIPFREGSKAAQVYALVGRPQGATAHELQELTGWQRHSVRVFLSASLRKQGQKVRSFERAGERVYRLKG
ncbi:MAG: DUF3489 domain-containing protein [Bryobacteraceae bacterium]